jgi:hypothetical protein
VAEAEKAHRQALQLRERLVAEHPEVVDYKVELGWTLGALGSLYASHGKSKEGRQYLERARKILRDVVDKYPDLVEAQRLLKWLEEVYRELDSK